MTNSGGDPNAGVNPVAPITDETWILSCPKCGRWKPLSETGAGVRMGARSIGKRILGHCSSCGTFRMFRLERPPQIPDDRLQAMLDNTPDQ